VQTTLPFFLAIAIGSLTAVHASRDQADLFSAADAYERFMGRWSRALAPLLVRFAGVRDGEQILDVGSGTGALADAILSAGAAARVVGIDPAAAYVSYAQSRHADARARFEVGDAQQLRFTDNSFDRTVSLLVLNFIPDRAKALTEMIRVTRRGGTVAAAVWDYGEGMEMLRIFWDEAAAVSASARAVDEREMPLCRPGELAAFWQQHGLRNVSKKPIVIRTRFASFDDYWSPFLERQGPAGAYVATLNETQREQLRMRLRRRLIGNGPDHSFTLSARAWAVRGVVPLTESSPHTPQRKPRRP
jgi:SAM-dependent methyltransferase